MLPCYCIAWLSHVLPWKLGATPFLWLCHGWVGWGTKCFPGLPFPRGVSEGRCFSQPAVLKAYTGTSQCGSQPGWLVVFHWFRPSVDGPSWTQWGSMPVLVRDLAP